jgi:DNA helicase IV
MTHGDEDQDGFEAEEAYLRRAHACLERMRERAVELKRVSRGFGGDSAMELDQAMARRVHSLRETGRALCFGRMDEESGARWYVGRRHVEDEEGEPVVVEWRAPVAEPFYRATGARPAGLRRRRHFLVDGPRLLSMADDVFGGEQGAATSGSRAALLVELERARTGEMADIVSTIQPEQYEMIRSPAAGLLFVQGGPGWGKTAVGLHRAAYLLYADEALARSGVLVVGPNPAFLRYIAQVLPSLGEESVVQVTFSDLVRQARVVGHGLEAPEVERLKGDARMAEVLARALGSYRRAPDAALEVGVGLRRLVLPVEQLAALVDAVAALRLPYSGGRTLLREKLVGTLHRSMGVLGPTDYEPEIRRHPELKRMLDHLWPSVSPVSLVAELLGRSGRLARVAEGLLEPGEQALLARRRPRAWTVADGPLVDEARELVAGRGRTFGHAIVDEAQDLSPMQLRMLGRRCPAGSMTLLGDLAQGTGVWAHESWHDLARHLPDPDGVRIEELRYGYRSPAEVLDLANRLLPAAAPGVAPTEAVRSGHGAPTFVAVAADRLLTTVAAETAALAGVHRSVGVIAPVRLLAQVRAAVVEAGVDAGDPAQDGLDRPVTVLDAQTSRGLEFDAVVVVEPAGILEDAVRGLRLLYVAITRPTRHLAVVSSRPLPEALATAARAAAA